MGIQCGEGEVRPTLSLNSIKCAVQKILQYYTVYLLAIQIEAKHLILFQTRTAVLEYVIR
jgi:hypothetical protein